MKKTVLIIVFILMLTMICGCGYGQKQTVDTPSDHKCIECGKTATHYMGKKWVDYSTIDLYYCDSCYNVVIKKAENEHRVAKPWW